MIVEGVEVSGGSPERQVSPDRRSMVAVEELRRAFELVEVSTPGFSDTFLHCIITQLQRGYVYYNYIWITFNIINNFHKSTELCDGFHGELHSYFLRYNNCIHNNYMYM